MITQSKYLSVLLIFFASVCFLFCSNEALADAQANRTVTVTCDPLVTPDFGECDVEETLTVVNGCGKTIEVSYNGGDFNEVLAGASIEFECTQGIDCYTVYVPAKLGGIESSSGCSEPAGWEQIPTLTQWGLIVLTLLIAGTGIWLLMRKRLAHKGGLA